MKRILGQNALPAWKIQKNRKPLLLRGARQVGKTHLIRSFAKKNFKNLIEINFELQPQLKQAFTTLEPTEIVHQLHLIFNSSINPGETLLFLDEIQDCPQAILALRYFYEKLPELHVIGAGSLLEFCLRDESFKMPVGRVSYLYLQPFSFEEFLSALEEEGLLSALSEMSLKKNIPELLHEKLLTHFKTYLRIGGMPAVILSYLENKTSAQYQNEQTLLLQTYRDDFGKYASNKSQLIYLQKVFNTAPSLVSARYKYSHVDRDTPSRNIKEALSLLTQAGVIQKVVTASAQGLPFHIDEDKFKIIFLDIGLMQRGCGLDAQIALSEDFFAINSGALAEQVVGQELLAYSNPYEDRKLYFWVRDKKSSQAEVDYLLNYQANIIPLEVKSGSTGSLKSLNLFMNEHQTKLAVRVSQHPLSLHQRILSIPLYAINQWERLVEEGLG